ncbi:MAG: uncharacterized protein A8A55_2143 [Amphiamblys sp. WSBS2006]|nr:MAG: uncharacterized protein A8A55_2143 [Amphiamblys sp. WSBS2006]
MGIALSKQHCEFFYPCIKCMKTFNTELYAEQNENGELSLSCVNEPLSAFTTIYFNPKLVVKTEETHPPFCIKIPTGAVLAIVDVGKRMGNVCVNLADDNLIATIVNNEYTERIAEFVYEETTRVYADYMEPSSYKNVWRVDPVFWSELIENTEKIPSEITLSFEETIEAKWSEVALKTVSKHGVQSSIVSDTSLFEAYEVGKSCSLITSGAEFAAIVEACLSISAPISGYFTENIPHLLLTANCGKDIHWDFVLSTVNRDTLHDEEDIPSPVFDETGGETTE